MMQNKSYILILLCVLLLLGGCKKKKQSAVSVEPAPVEQPSTPVTPVAPATPTAPAAPTTPAKAEEPELQPMPEEPAKPEVQTLWIQRMTVTIDDRGRRFSTPATLRWERGVGAILSIQPFAGIEMMRAEVTPEQVVIINKLTHSYAQAGATQVKKSYALDLPTVLDASVDKELIDRLNEPVIHLQQTQGQTTIEIAINTKYVLLNENVNIQPTNIQGYKKVSAEQLLQALL